MVKCWAEWTDPKTGKTVKCHRNLAECLASRGQHVGRRFLGVKEGRFLNAAWSDSTQPDTSPPEGQIRLRSEIRRLRYARLDASRFKQPRQYRVFTERLTLLASFVVKEFRNRHGVVSRVRVASDGIVRPVGQKVLE